MVSHSTRPRATRVAPAVVAAIAGYVIGMVPSADVASKLAGGPDLRSTGSGNPGAANAAAVLGPRFGLAVLVVDMAKGAAAGRLGHRLGGGPLANVGSVAAVVGHCYPAVTTGGSGRFRGGKGVATSVGQVLATFPVYFPIDTAVAVATAASPHWKRRAFAATSISSAVWVASSLLWVRRGWPNAWGGTPTKALPIGAAVSSAVIASRFAAGQSPSPPPHERPPHERPPHEGPRPAPAHESGTAD